MLKSISFGEFYSITLNWINRKLIPILFDKNSSRIENRFGYEKLHSSYYFTFNIFISKLS
jgi:hypothetical protein